MTNPPGAMPPLPEPKVLRLVDNEGFSDEAPYMCGSLVEITGAQAVA